MAVLCGIPLVLWARAAPIGPRFSTSTLALTSTAVLFAFAGTAAFAINLVLGARHPLRRVALRRSRPHVPRAPPERPDRLRAARDARVPDLRRARDDLGLVRLRPRDAARRADRLRRLRRADRDGDRARADAVRPARAGGLRLRPAHVRLRLPARDLPRLHDARREGSVAGAEVVHGGARHGRHRGVRLPLALPQRARAPQALHGDGRQPARRLRHGDRARAASRSRSSTGRGSSSS